MAERNFKELLGLQNEAQNYGCVGLDTDINVIRKLLPISGLHFPAMATDLDKVVKYNQMVVDVTRDKAAAYKPNLSFYKFLGLDYYNSVIQTVQMIHQMAPNIPVVHDAKLGDIGSSNYGHVFEIFETLMGDAVTVHNYMGSEAMMPFLEQKNKGIFALVRTSNPGSREIQDLQITGQLNGNGQHENLSKRIARIVREKWNVSGNCGAVVGATEATEAEILRGILGPEFPLLIPGVGEQGQTAERIVAAALHQGESGLINSSRGIIFPKRRAGERQSDAIRRAFLSLYNEIVETQRNLQLV